jgi:hypothetical protein
MLVTEVAISVHTACSALSNVRGKWTVYCLQITSWAPQGMLVLRQCKVPRAEVMFITIQRENIRLSKKEMNKAANA